jgi:cell division initiation protein
MITPLDIQNKQFPKVVRGYKEEDVDGFLDLVTLDYDKVLKENHDLKEQVKNITMEMNKYKSSQETIYETLETAKKLMNDISESAEKRASMVLKNAELDGQIILREAKESVEKLGEEYVSIKNRLNIFKTRYKSLLESELEKFDVLSSDIFSDKDLEDLKSITGDNRKNTILIEKREINSNSSNEKDKKNTIETKFGDGLL